MTRTAPTPLIAALAVLALLGVALAAGCTTTSSGPATTPTPAGTGAGTVSTVGTSGSGSATVSADRLVVFIPEAAGAWKLDGEAQKISMQGGQGQDFSQAMGQYVKTGNDEMTANIVIMDTAVANNYKQQWSSFQSIETNDGWWRSVTVKGQPGWKSYTKDSNDYAQWVLAGDRYIVIATVESGAEADLDALVNAVDFAGLAAVR